MKAINYTKQDLGVKVISKVEKVNDTLFSTTLNNLDSNVFFTLKPIDFPKDNQVYTRDFYDRESKKYCISNYSNTTERFVKGDKLVYINFEF
jgi:hypothetical protein